MPENGQTPAPGPAKPAKPLAAATAGCCGGPIAASQQMEESASEDAEDIKKKVQSYYSERVQSPHTDTTIARACCPSSTPASSSTANLAGYDTATLQDLPQAAVEKSFGCGDPLHFAEVQSGEALLDIGSGAGIDCFIAAKKVGATGKVIGLDMTPAMLEAARRNAREGGFTNVEFRQGDAENMPVANNSIDWVISNCVINLAPDKRKVFSEIHRVLKPGGRISISDLVAEELPRALRNSGVAYCACIGGASSTDEYLTLLTQAGLVDVHVASRLDYDSVQIAELVRQDPSLRSAYGDIIDKARVLLNQVKVASIKVLGRKPDVSETPVYTVQPLQRRHLPAMEGLLTENNLPRDDLDISLNDAFVATHNDRVIAGVTMERYGNAGLLRSFVVCSGWRGRGVGKAVAKALLKHAARSGIREVYLLTTTIKDMAARFGFRLIQRQEVPAAVRESVQFGLNQCASAAVMKMDLPVDN